MLKDFVFVIFEKLFLYTHECTVKVADGHQVQANGALLVFGILADAGAPHVSASLDFSL